MGIGEDETRQARPPTPFELEGAPGQPEAGSGENGKAAHRINGARCSASASMPNGYHRAFLRLLHGLGGARLSYVAAMSTYAEIVNAALDATEARDPERMIAFWAEDGVLEFPFAPEGFPSQVAGRAALLEFFHQFPKYYSEIRILDRTVEALADGEGAVAQYRGEWVNLKGVPYNNRYIAVFRFREGRVAHMREYFNPQIWVDSLRSDHRS